MYKARPPTFAKPSFLNHSSDENNSSTHSKNCAFTHTGLMASREKELRKIFERFVESAGLEGRGESAVFRDLLSRVDVPSSFRSEQQSSSYSSSGSSLSNSYSKGMRPIISNPSTSAEQAWAICAPQAKLAGRQASSSYRPSSSSIDCDFIGRSAFCDKSSSGGGFW